MRIVVDIEANSLGNPTKVWLVCTKDIDTGETHVFRPETNPADRKLVAEFLSRAMLVVGHNILGYDLPALRRCGILRDEIPIERVCDTLVLSRLFDYSRPSGHSLSSYGEEFGLEKIKFSDWTKLTPEMEVYCGRDVDINLRVFQRFHRMWSDPSWRTSVVIEHRFQREVVNALHDTGFAFNSNKAISLLEKVTTELGALDARIKEAFPPKLVLVKEIHPRLTRYGTLNRSDFRWFGSSDLSEFNGGPFCRCEWKEFNAASHRQVVEVLTLANWSPTEKTTAHIDLEREISRQKYIPEDKRTLDISISYVRLTELQKTGWKINETNLATLPENAPAPARLLAQRILLEARRRTLTEWLSLVQDDGRIHGNFQGIGAWTHRMAHQRPNTANIPNEFDTQGKRKLLGKEMRSLWIAPKKRLLVGVDAEGIQLRIFAHYINDPEFTQALVEGKKDDKTDPHSLNQRILGSVCKSRAAAKRFIYALLLGAGLWKLSQILECSEAECKEALDRLLQRYTGWQRIRQEDIPKDAERGYFIGLDNRKVSIPGQTRSQRAHLCMSGYLQNGEAVVMKHASLEWKEQLKDEVDPIDLVNMVHDEWQTECPNRMDVALRVAEVQARSLEVVGKRLGLRCPLAGSYWNDDHKDYTIGTNWSVTH